MKQLFGLFEYSTDNVGDEIQSIAAERFLPRIDYYFNRDNIDATIIPKDANVKIIANGWFMHTKNWPPKVDITILPISMYIEKNAYGGEIAKNFVSSESAAFLNKFGPVGARSLSTESLLNEHGIKSYFSGCLTLTLNRESTIKKENYVLAVDVSDAVYEEIKSRTKRPVLRINNYHSFSMDSNQKFLMARYWLCLIQSAHVVVTTRLHCMMPCLSLQTPVLAISGRDQERYGGLIDLTNNMTESEFLSKKCAYDIDSPPENPKDYLSLRSNLERSCKKFTGFDSKNSFLGNKSYSDFINSMEFKIFCTNLMEKSKDLEQAQEINTDLLARNRKITMENSKLKASLAAWETAGVKVAFRNFKSSVRRYIKKIFFRH